MDQGPEKNISRQTDNAATFSSPGHSYSPGHGYGMPNSEKERRTSKTVFAAICIICLVLAAALGSVATLLIMGKRAELRSESEDRSSSYTDSESYQTELSEQSIFGVTLTTVSAGAAQYYNLVEGAYVYSVSDGSRAALAGLQTGDIITAVAATETLDADSLIAVLQACSDSDPVELTVFRDQQTVTLTLPAV